MEQTLKSRCYQHSSGFGIPGENIIHYTSDCRICQVLQKCISPKARTPTHERTAEHHSCRRNHFLHAGTESCQKYQHAASSGNWSAGFCTDACTVRTGGTDLTAACRENSPDPAPIRRCRRKAETVSGALYRRRTSTVSGEILSAGGGTRQSVKRAGAGGNAPAAGETAGKRTGSETGIRQLVGKRLRKGSAESLPCSLSRV